MPAHLPTPLPLAELFGSGEMMVMSLLVLIFFFGDMLPGLTRRLGKFEQKFKKSSCDTCTGIKRTVEESEAKYGQAPGSRASRKLLWRGIVAIAVGIVIVARAVEEINPGSTPGLFASGRPVGAIEPYVTLGLGLTILYLGCWWCTKRPRE
jgi:Sec-independent protein translocase protein TatA